MNEQFLEQKHKFLKQLAEESGYPRTAFSQGLLLEMHNGRLCEPDLVIVNPKNGEPLAVVEFKAEGAQRRESPSAQKQLLNLMFATQEAFGKKNGLPGYLVLHAPGGQRYFSVTRDANAPLTEIAYFPTFEELVVRAKSDDLLEKKSEQIQAKEGRRRTIDRFRIGCWSLAAIVLGFLIADLFKWFSLSSQQISLFSAFVALIVIPDVAKLKLLGVEFERHKETKTEANESSEKTENGGRC